MSTKWHKVEDKLPKPGKMVQVITTLYTDPVTGFYGKDGNWYKHPGGSSHQTTVTHWCKLPKPPKVEEESCEVDIYLAREEPCGCVVPVKASLVPDPERVTITLTFRPDKLWWYRTHTFFRITGGGGYPSLNEAFQAAKEKL